MTVKSKSGLHTKLVVLASSESVLSEKWARKEALTRQKRSFATKQLAE